MKNKWTTLEEKTEKANEAISKILNEPEIRETSPKNKVLAIGMAVVGVVLIGLGVSPFLGLEADINIFQDPASVDNVDDVDPVDPSLDEWAQDNNFSPEEFDFMADTNPESEVMPMDTEPPAAPSDEPTAPMEDSSPRIFPMNTHTGLTDPNTVVFGDEEAVVPTLSSVSHAAADEEMTQSGPEAWLAVAIALVATLALRRRKLKLWG